MDLEEKRAELEKLKKERSRIMKKIIALAKLSPPKRTSTAIKRAGKVVWLACQIRVLEQQAYLIMSQPIPRHGKGMVIAGEGKMESVITSKDKVYEIPKP